MILITLMVRSIFILGGKTTKRNGVGGEGAKTIERGGGEGEGVSPCHSMDFFKKLEYENRILEHLKTIF